MKSAQRPMIMHGAFSTASLIILLSAMNSMSSFERMWSAVCALSLPIIHFSQNDGIVCSFRVMKSSSMLLFCAARLMNSLS